MAMLQLLIIWNYSRRISCILIVYLLNIFDTGPNPTRPMDGPDPRPTLCVLELAAVTA